MGKEKQQTNQSIQYFTDWNNPTSKNFNQQGTKQIQAMSKDAQQRVEQKAKARQLTKREQSKPGWSVSGAYQKNQLVNLQEQLYNMGAFADGISYKKAVDGLDGKLTQAAIKKAQSMGYSYDPVSKTLSNKPNSQAKQTKMAEDPRYLQAIQAVSQDKFGVQKDPSKNNFSSAVLRVLDFFVTPAQAKESQTVITEKPQEQPSLTEGGKGRAIYLHYPNFEGKMSNAMTIGGVDVGKKISELTGIKDKLPVGHGETLLVDPNGKVKYVRYGRYKSGTGEVRNSVKGGNWGIYDYPDMKQGETTEQYIERNKGKIFKGQRMFEDASYGAFEAIDIPNVDYNKALQYATAQANDKNRSEYNIANTCATGATNTIKAGLSTWDKLKTYLPNFSGSDAETAKGSTFWGWLPGSTNSYARNMRNLGESTIIRKNGGNLDKKVYFQI